MNDKPAAPASIHSRLPALALREACHKAGDYEDGRRCSLCPLKELCDNDERWLVGFRLH